MQISVTRTTAPKAKTPDNELGFGRVFSDHMFLMDWNIDKGWYDPRIVPFGDFSLSPSCAVFHYGAEVFEGLKAYRTVTGEIRLFRPDKNFERLVNSAERVSLPAPDPADAVEALRALVDIDRDWVPHSEGTSLYVRPFIIATDVNLGVHGTKNALFAIILSPSGSYYKEGINPVKIMIETEDVRTVRGGTGYAKCGGNYAASTRAGDKASKMGFSQVLWLDGVERKYIEEVGSMNVMFKLGDTVVTPKLTGSVLPGITRMSIVELLKDRGVKVEERLFSVDELVAAAASGELKEAWGTGTAAVVSPIGELAYDGKEYIVNGGNIGELTQSLYDELTAIQWGKVEDKKGWTVKV
ncbi:MAG: branched-chain amino acid aminotransferase [Clostridia bacterium]|nr:branched-chain amino acid aminotransferase [Clostridia bacterium]